MSHKEEILERVKRKEALVFYNSLKYADVEDVVLYEDLPEVVRISAADFIKISSNSIAKLPCSSQVQEVVKLLIGSFDEPIGEIFIFKPAETYWKYWVRLKISNFTAFITDYLLNSTSKEFYLYRYLDDKIIFLSNDEYDFQLFANRK